MRSIILAGVVLAIGSLVSSCGGDESTNNFIGTWGQVDADPETNIQAFERTNDLSAYRTGFEIGLDGSLVVRTLEYVGHDFPSPVEYPGTWESGAGNVLIFRYENYRGEFTILFEILDLQNQEMTGISTVEGPVKQQS